jgi:DNA-damage-inducible protein D
MTGLNVQNKDLQGQNPIEREHVDNSTAVRNMLVNRGIYPERLSASEDTDKTPTGCKHSVNPVLFL